MVVRFVLALYLSLCITLNCDRINSVEGLSIADIPKSKTSLSRRHVIPFLTAGVMVVASPPSHSENTDEYIATPRGLKYKTTKSPDDPESQTPERAQKVKASYTLYLNGFPEDTTSSVKVDSSKGFLGEKPFEFLAGVSQVIKGWDLAIMEMRVGEAQKLVIKSDLGYGDKGAGGKIPGGATLYFDVELLELGAKSKVGPEQLKWLEEHPL